MNLSEYQQRVAELPTGKRLPTAVYVYWCEGLQLGAELSKIVARLTVQHELGLEFNVIKFRTDELKLSFLSYPDFMREAHPELRQSLTIDLVTGRARRTDYTKNLNPPILHRKEEFLPNGHPDRASFAALTLAEENEGLYEETTTIGFKLNWERVLAAKGLTIAGHKLGRVTTPLENTPENVPFVERHKTALTRYELSKPIKTLLEYGVLRPGATFFDYGCGQGSDVRGLQSLGYEADGWDPVYRHDAVKREAEIVNMGYVLNVIEDPAERLEALVDAYRHMRRLLVVSALISETVETDRAMQYRDGVLTKRNTFQKYFEQQELQQYIEDALDSTAVPVALGVFYVFRNPADQQDFLAARSRRTIEWTQISARLGLGAPKTFWTGLYEQNKDLLDSFGKTALELGRFPEPTEYPNIAVVLDRLGTPQRALRAFVQGGGAGDVSWDHIRVQFGIGQPVKRRWEILCEENRELLDAFWTLMLELGRLPEAEEFSQTGQLREKVGSPKQAFRLFINKGGAAEMKRAADNRRRDLLVYVALANLRRRVAFGHLSMSLRADVRSFFGNYTRALKEGLELLYAAGDSGEIQLACEELKIGWQDEQALYIHRSLLDQLPPVLRAYVGCATALFGDVAQADVIKLHKGSGKVTFLVYDDFDGKPLPELKQRIKVNLRTRWVQVFDHSADGQFLYFKERFLAETHPNINDMRAFSSKLTKLGLSAATAFGLDKAEFERLRRNAGFNEKLNKIRSRRKTES